MGRVNLKPRRELNIIAAYACGDEAQRRVAGLVAAKARLLAEQRKRHTSVADDIDIDVHAHGLHVSVELNVKGRNGANVSMALENGYYNEWLENKYGEGDIRAFMPGMHIMRDAKASVVRAVAA